ncbi:hypothetical protein COB55_02625 [Candidatus Wolfebacteria bacterium]|nr:MAG: hypothetical protein COB55_02625 [Candidatus Wolfebacteria bacterium]
MKNGIVEAICICSKRGEPMREVNEVEAIAGAGLAGDRYATGEGSFNRNAVGNRQVTLINGIFFENSPFGYLESRRNIVTLGVELMWLIGREFDIGEARMKGVKYCDPCVRPSKLLNKSEIFSTEFFDRGGLIADILQGGLIKKGDAIILPIKRY